MRFLTLLFTQAPTRFTLRTILSPIIFVELWFIYAEVDINIMVKKVSTCIQLPQDLIDKIKLTKQKTSWSQNFIIEQALRLLFSENAKVTFKKDEKVSLPQKSRV